MAAGAHRAGVCPANSACILLSLLEEAHGHQLAPPLWDERPGPAETWCQLRFPRLPPPACPELSLPPEPRSPCPCAWEDAPTGSQCLPVRMDSSHLRSTAWPGPHRSESLHVTDGETGPEDSDCLSQVRGAGLGIESRSARLSSNHVTVGKLLCLGLDFSIQKMGAVIVPSP